VITLHKVKIGNLGLQINQYRVSDLFETYNVQYVYDTQTKIYRRTFDPIPAA